MPTYILGINAFHADAAAVLLRDGECIGAIAEERLNRVKHFAGFPKLAIAKLLEMAGIGLADVQHVAIGRDSTANLKEKLVFSMKNILRLPQLARQRLENRAQIADIPELLTSHFGLAGSPATALAGQAGPSRASLAGSPATALAGQAGPSRASLAGSPTGAPTVRIHNVEHHLCHAASAYLTSPFEHAAILSIDGFGDFASTMTAVGEGARFKVLDRVHFPHSLGVFYSAVCQFIGYTSYGDEGKVMGLAPYGEPRYLDLMRELVKTVPDGKFELGLDWFVHHSEGTDYGHDENGRPTLANLFSKKFVERLGAPRPKGSEITQRDMDLARSMQARFEEVYFHILRHLHRETRTDALVIAGGVALNSVANGKLFAETPFRRLYAHPAATDDGTAFGAAYFVHCMTLGNPRPAPMMHAYLGNGYDDDQIAAALTRAGVTAERLPFPLLAEKTAQQIAQGKVVGWFQGRMEWGPRALGARSIVAHPGLPTMKDTLNARIKHREWFRPFAPSILEERTAEYFAESYPAPFMMQVYPTRPEKYDALCAVDHVDHTGRLQTVSQDACPAYYALIKAFEAETGLPVVLNTSFNENEPIVCTPDEAIDCYLRTKMDALAIGSFLAVKPASD